MVVVSAVADLRNDCLSLGNISPINFVLYISIPYVDYVRKKLVIKNNIIIDTFFSLLHKSPLGEFPDSPLCDSLLIFVNGLWYFQGNYINLNKYTCNVFWLTIKLCINCVFWIWKKNQRLIFFYFKICLILVYHIIFIMFYNIYDNRLQLSYVLIIKLS